jgi:hypothetical protein
MSNGSLSFLTPQFFDLLVIGCIVVGGILAARRIYSDFKRGPRYEEDRPAQEDRQ